MPSFSRLSSKLHRYRRSEDSSNGIKSERSDSGVVVEDLVQTKKEQSKPQSKRDYFHTLLKSVGKSNSTKRRNDNHQSKKRASAPPRTTPVLSTDNQPMSPMSDPNKPLPPPPQFNKQQETEVKQKPVRLDRISSPLSQSEIHNLFSGAPQYFVRSEGHYTGPPHPSVAFPWDTGLATRDLKDHGQIEDAAWSCATAWPHIVVNNGAGSEDPLIPRPHFIPRCRERPNILSMQGLEKGTIGFQAALESGVADALQEEEDLRPDPGAELAERRSSFLRSGKHGVRALDDAAIITQLIDISTIYHEDPESHLKSTVDMYTLLFTRLLYPPERVTDITDPYSLHVQIEALMGILAAPAVWVDFSLVEWRIRLGQIIWGAPDEPDTDDDVSINGVSVDDVGSQKYWLLLQILISCELLLRLDMVTKQKKGATPTEVHRFEKLANINVKWSLILARLWLENVRIEGGKPKFTEKKPAGWLATLTGFKAQPSENVEFSVFDSTDFLSRHQNRQISGLIHFARNIKWPYIDDLAPRILNQYKNEAEQTIIATTPTSGTPLSITALRTSYFGGNTQRPTLRRGLSRQRISTLIHPSGWLSRSYLTGLILPGEALSHLLISTLLENDKEAVKTLGEEANLYGGFIYENRSFWSSGCIVGRVLAAGAGATECMGWISSDVLPQGVSEGWLDIEAEDEFVVADLRSSNGEDARIWNNKVVESDSAVLGSGDVSHVLPGDFTLPTDKTSEVPGFEVSFRALYLEGVDEPDVTNEYDSGDDAVQLTPATEVSSTSDYTHQAPAIKSFNAIMEFSVKTESDGLEFFSLKLAYETRFVTAHPCIPSQHTRLISPNMTPILYQQTHSKAAPAHIGHPLHSSYNYSQHTLLSVLRRSPNDSKNFASILDILSTTNSPTEVYVIDCSPHEKPMIKPHVATLWADDRVGTAETGESAAHVEPASEARDTNAADMEILARAWCSANGFNALISRRHAHAHARGAEAAFGNANPGCCVACSVREARALGWRIVLRIG